MNSSKLALSQREQRTLPSRPNLEHLKSQAKDLLAAQRRGEPEALARIRAAVPAYANQSDDAIRNGPFALHDAQSAIAREYGFPSWAALRTHVENAEKAAAVEAPAAPAAPAAAAVDPLALLTALTGQALPPELHAGVRAAIQHRGSATSHPTPPRVPVIPLRNAVAFPGALFPIDVGRSSSLHALEAAQSSEPPLVAVFSQRDVSTESPSADDLHPTGCLCHVLYAHRPAQSARILLEGIRWVSLDTLEQVDPFYLARVSDAHHTPADPNALGALDTQLRDRARRLAATLAPEVRNQAIALIDATADPQQLADLVMANMNLPVDDKAAYARETDTVRKFETVIAQLDTALAAATK